MTRLAAFLLATGLLAGAGTACAASPSQPALEGLASSPACQTVRAQHPGLAGRDLTIGLGGYAQGFELPNAADPGRLDGFDPDLFDALDACLGTGHHVLVTSFSILIASIGSGRVDVGALLYVTPARARRVRFVSVMRVVDGAILRRNGARITGLDALCGRRVGAAAGTYEAATLVPDQSQACIAAGRAPVGVMLVQNSDAALQSLRAGRVDVVFTARPQAVAAAASDPSLVFGFTLGLPILAGYPISKAKPDLARAVRDAMRAIQSAGIERAALTHWGLDASAEQPATLTD